MPRTILIAIVIVAISALPAFAQDDVQARISALEAQVAQLQKQLQDLRAAVPATPPSEPAPAPAPAATFTPTVTVGGMMETQFTLAASGSLKQPIFASPSGNADFILTHVHPSIRATLDEKTSALLTLCTTHEGSTEVYEAYVEHAPNDRLDAKMGRFLLPFGAWNPISNAAMFKSVSRPLMYLGHEDRGIVLQGGPRPILNDEHSDVGLLLSGRSEGKSAIVKWDGYVSNGFADQFGDYPDAWIDFRSSQDNNTSKSLGARIAASTPCGFTLGASWTGGKWDPQNKYRYDIAGADATWQMRSGLTLRAEYATNPIGRSAADGGKIHRHGWYAMAEKPVGQKWTAVAMYSTLSERPTANVNHVARLTLGADYRLADSTTIKTEIGRLFIGRFIGNASNAPQGTEFGDVTTLKVSSVVSF
ncbi:MAG TPA: hypothetical protein VGM51_16265 [Armatimonadota bacterium]|jgi:type II secretory pathway pseudopilin PulG